MNLTCPSCKKVLRSKIPIPPGKIIKCPGCGHPFAVPADEQAVVPVVHANGSTNQLIQEGLAELAAEGQPMQQDRLRKTDYADDLDDDGRPSRNKRRYEDEDDDDVPRRRRRRDDDEEDEADDDDRPRRKRRRDEDEDAEADDDDRPRRKRRRDEDEEDDEDDRPRKRRQRDEEEDQEDDDDRPRRKRRRDEEDEEEEDDRPRRKRRRDEVEEEDEEEDDDDRPRRRGRKKRPSQAALWIGLGAGGGALLLIFIVTAFLWPGFLLSGGGGGATDGGKRYLPAEASVVFGVDFTVAGNALYKKKMQEMASEKMRGVDRELLDDIQWVLVGVCGTPPNERGTVVFQTGKAVDAEKVRKAFNAEAAEKLKGGQTVYRIKDKGFVHLPNPTLILMSETSEEKFVKLLESSASAMPAAMQAQIRTVSGNAIWSVFSLEGELGKQIKQAKDDFKAMPMMPPAFEDGLNALSVAKFVTVRANPSADAKTLKIELSLVCGSGADATKIHGEISPKIKGLAAMAGLMPGDMGKNLAKDLESLKVEASGPNVTASVTLSEALIKEFSDGFGGPPRQPVPPPNFPPPKIKKLQK